MYHLSFNFVLLFSFLFFLALIVPFFYFLIFLISLHRTAAN